MNQTRFGKNMRGSLVGFVIKSAVLIAIAIAIFTLLERYHLAKVPDLVKIQVIPALVLIQLILVVLSGLSWKLLLKHSASIDVSFSDSIAQLGVVFVGKYIPGKVWGGLLRIKALQRSGHDIPSLVGVTFLEQIMVLCSALILGGVMYFYHQKEGMALVLVISLISVFILRPVLMLVGNLSKLLMSSIGERFTSAADVVGGMGWIPQLLVFMTYMLNWLISGVLLAALAYSLGIEFNLEVGIKIASACVLSVLIGFFALFAPGGIGVREVSLVALLGEVIGYEIALTLAMFYRIWTTALDCLWGVFSFWYSNRQGWLS